MANVVAAAEPAAPVTPPSEVQGEAAASLAAQRHDTPVRVAERTSETEEVVANPDGTFTFSQSLYPVRVRQGDEWRPVDLTLTQREDGSVGPVAATVDLRLSGGGEGPLVVLGKGDHEIGLGWSGSLPKPVLDGPTATYPEVFPGVDILVTAEIGGFSQVLVVKDAKAADNPALRTISYPSHTKNTQVEGGQDGLTVRAADGQVVFTGDASRMWDSAGQADAARSLTSPEMGARHATMGVEVTDAAVAITPDQAFLDDPDTVYPVFLDPEYSWPHGRRNHHVVVQSAWPNEQNYDKTTGDLNDLKAGYACDNGQCFTSRSYVEMNTAGLAGKFIHSATLGTTVIHSHSCAGAGPTGLWLAGAIDQQTTWAHQPGLLYGLWTTNVTNNATHCPNPHGGGAEFNVTRAVKDASDHGWPGVVLMFRGEDQHENQASHWRRFALNPHMQVVYNSYPNTPDTLSMRSGTKAVACATGANRPFIADTQPWLRARFSDPDGGMLNTRFYWSPLGQPVSGSAPTYDVPSGSFDEVQVPAGAFANGSTYSWRTHVSDYQLVSKQYSAYCEVTIDTTVPAAPTVSSTDFPKEPATGNAGDSGRFTLSANGTTDVVRYVYTTDGTDPTVLGSPAINAAGLGGSAALTLTAREGLNILRVRSVDRANNMGPVVDYKFTANALRPAVASWSLDSSLDNLTYAGTGAPSWVEGYTGGAVGLNAASNGHLTAPGAIVDTRQNFSVSAWVRPDSSVGYQTVASQDGTTSSSFFLQYHDGLDRWAFRAADGDNANPVVATAASSQAPVWHQWTHLLGTYDAPAKKLRLYVNGVFQSEASFTANWAGSGPFVVGAAKAGGQRINYFTGGVDAVQVWNRVVGPEETGQLNNAAVLRAHYNLDEATGTSTRDEVSGQNATFHGDASWTTDEYTAVRLTGNAGSEITGPRPSVRTGQSFTVSAWVRIEEANSITRTAVAFADPAYSPFLLGYNGGHRKWGFGTVRADHTTSWALTSVDFGEVGRWVYLSGVYDSVRQELRLYVDGELEDTQGNVTAWGGTGGLQVGGGTWDGQPLDTWKGWVDDIRVYSGVRDIAGIEEDRLARTTQGS